MGFFNIFDGDCEPGAGLFIELFMVEDGEDAADTFPDEEEEEAEEDVEDEWVDEEEDKSVISSGDST